MNLLAAIRWVFKRADPNAPPLGYLTSSEGNILSYHREDGFWYKASYDPLNRMTRYEDSDGARYRYEYTGDRRTHFSTAGFECNRD